MLYYLKILPTIILIILFDQRKTSNACNFKENQQMI